MGKAGNNTYATSATGTKNALAVDVVTQADV